MTEWLMGPPGRPELPDLFARPAWMAQGLCRWFPTIEFVPPANAPGRDAKEVCHSGCPVLLECLRYAVENDEVGVWGGTTQLERRAARRRKAG